MSFPFRGMQPLFPGVAWKESSQTLYVDPDMVIGHGFPPDGDGALQCWLATVLCSAITKVAVKFPEVRFGVVRILGYPTDKGDKAA